VRDSSAFEDAQRDYRDAAGKREATAILPRAWADLITEAHEMLIETVADKAEVLCGYRPEPRAVLAFLTTLKSRGAPVAVPTAAPLPQSPGSSAQPRSVAPSATSDSADANTSNERGLSYTLFGQTLNAPTAKIAFLDVMRSICNRDVTKIEALADAIRTKSRAQIARTPAEINPGHPERADATELAPGWLLGLHMSNRDKMKIIRAACDVYGIRIPEDLEVSLPNA
jgi:hypothetical protein